MKRFALILWHQMATQTARPFVLAATLAVPLLLAALLHLAFGGLVLGQSIPEERVPVGIVNLDQGGAWGNLGDLFVQAFASDEPAVSALHGNLFAAREIADEAQARRLVERGRLVAALFIPADFSEAVARQEASVRVYIYGGEDVLGMAFATAVETLADAVASGEIAVRTAVGALDEQARTRTLLRSGAYNEALTDLAKTAALPASNPVQVEYVALSGQLPGISLAHYIAVAIAILFSGLTALMGSATLYQERAQWTWQRTLLAPVRPALILGAKTLATYLLCVLQMLVLLGSLVALETAFGNGQAHAGAVDLVGLGGLVLTEALAATGVGVVVAGLCGTYTRAANYGRMLLVLMGLVGGVFFPANLLPSVFAPLSRATFQYWAMEGYLCLARGEGAANVVLHMLVMAAMGGLFFVVGSLLTRQRLMRV